MRGKYTFKIANNKICYEFEIIRSVTVIKGNSGTGKSTLINLLSAYELYGRQSGIKCNANVKFTVFDNRTRWQQELTELKDTIIFADEHTEYILYDKQFAQMLKESGNYLVVVTRGVLNLIPYSIQSIFELKSDGGVVQLYRKYKEQIISNNMIQTILCEDENSGYQMIRKVFPDANVYSAKGNSNVKNCISNLQFDNLCVIVDGAAFGAYIQSVIDLQDLRAFTIFAPESFEYLLLKTKMFSRFLTDELSKTYNYSLSEETFTWENYYTKLLMNLCKDKYGFEYTKSKLNTHLENAAQIQEIKTIILQ